MAYSLKEAVRYLLQKGSVDRSLPERQIAKREAETESEKTARLERAREQEIFFWGVFPIL